MDNDELGTLLALLWEQSDRELTVSVAAGWIRVVVKDTHGEIINFAKEVDDYTLADCLVEADDQAKDYL